MRLQSEKYVDKYIIEALFSLMKKKDYNNISITEICEKAGTGRMSFYRNFNSKEDIIRQWITNTTNTFLKESDINYKNDSTKDYFIKLFTHLEKYKTEAMLIYKANLFNLLKNEFDDKLINLHQEEYSNYKSYFLAGGIFNVYYFWLINGCMETPYQVAEKLVDLMSK
jgi:AcrR family transcriptional regulator